VKSIGLEKAKQNLFEMKEVMDKLKIKFFLQRGTLLGAIREKAFIQGDIDIDLRMFARDWIPEIIKEFALRKFKCRVVRRYPDKIAKLTVLKRGIHADIMLEYYYPPEDIYFILSAWHFDISVITPARHYKGDCFINFLGKKFRIPEDPKDLLRLVYGDNWMTPTREEIVCESPPCQSWHKHWKWIDIKKYIEWIEEHPGEI